MSSQYDQYPYDKLCDKSFNGSVQIFLTVINIMSYSLKYFSNLFPIFSTFSDSSWKGDDEKYVVNFKLWKIGK